MQKRHRTFIAINLPSDVRRFLAGYEKKLNEVPAKWTVVENLHLTLVFLGDLTEIELGQVCVAIKEIAERHESFNMLLDKVAYGPEGKLPPRYIWAGGQDSQEASDLRNELENKLSEIVKFNLDTQMFRPHVTLARVNSMAWRAINPEEQQEVNEVIDLPFTVESIEVMESELTKQGPRYTVIESYPLK